MLGKIFLLGLVAVGGIAYLEKGALMPEGQAVLEHHHQNIPIQYCDRGNLDDVYLNSIVYRQNLVAGWVKDTTQFAAAFFGYDPVEFKRRRDQALLWMPTSNFICEAAQNGYKLTFERGWFSSAPSKMIIELQGRKTEAGIAVDWQKGEDGEPRSRIVSIGSFGSLDDMQQRKIVYCLGNSPGALAMGDLFSRAMPTRMTDLDSGESFQTGDFCRAALGDLRS